MNMFKKIITAAILAATTVGCGGCAAEVTGLETAEPVSPITWTECSYEQGDHACDLTLTDQNGEIWNLYNNHGKVIILDFSTMWCGYCQVAAAEVREVQEKYGDDIVYVTVLVEDQAGNVPDINDLDTWASVFGITNAPVLGGDRSLIKSADNDGWEVTGWPAFYFLTDDLVIHTSLRGFSSTAIDSLIQDTIAQ